MCVRTRTVIVVTAVALLCICARERGDRRVDFAGIMDLSRVGGSASEPYDGVFYDTAVAVPVGCSERHVVENRFAESFSKHVMRIGSNVFGLGTSATPKEAPDARSVQAGASPSIRVVLLDFESTQSNSPAVTWAPQWPHEPAMVTVSGALQLPHIPSARGAPRRRDIGSASRTSE